MHSFALSFSVRAQENGSIAEISGHTNEIAIETARTARGGSFQSATLKPGSAFSASVTFQNGKWTYHAANGANYVSSVFTDSGWHQVVISHYAARGETLFFVDGKLAGKAAERLEPNGFFIGGGIRGDVKDLMVFRSAINDDEAAALFAGKLLQASLEVYAPLSDARFEEGISLLLLQ